MPRWTARARVCGADGGIRRDGRWCIPPPSLAVLEVLVHLDLPPDLIPDDMVLLAIDVPDDATLHRLDRTPTDADACRQAGDAFLNAGQALGLRVPSVVVPQEANLLLNVRHADMTRVRVVGTDPFRFDPRLLR